MEGSSIRRRAVAETAGVRCLACGTEYVKPAEGSTAIRNPGCPDCGYVGWLAASVPFTRGGRSRSGGDLRPIPLFRPS